MDMEEKKQRIDARWDEINSQYSNLARKEREKLASLLEDDELPARVSIGTPSGSIFRNVLVVATDRQVLYVTTKETLRLTYADIRSVRMEGTKVEIVGERCTMSFTPGSLKDAERLVAYVKSEDKSPPGEQPISVEEKTYWINARWDEIKPQYSSLVGKERENLPSLLEDDELPERIVVGTPNVANDFALFPNWLRNVLVVATDKQVLYVTTTKTLRLTYADIESVSIQGGSVEIVGGAVQMKFTPVSRKEAERLVAYVSGEDSSPRGEPLPLHPRAVSIDQQWNTLKPALWGNRHSGEREMLYDLIEESETLESLIGGTYRAEQDTSRFHKHNGIAVATSKRVLFVDKGVLGSSEVSEMPYRNIEAITYSTGLMMAGVQITGRGIASFRIEDIVEKDSVKPFVDCVRGHLEAAHAPQASAPQPAAPLSAADEIEKLASLMERGVLTQEEFDAKKKQLLGL